MPGRVTRVVDAALEYAIPRIGITVTRALDPDVIGQAHHPRGAAGRVTAWEMAHRPSNRRRSIWAVLLLDIQPGDQVLEIGYGPGVAIAALAREGAGHVYGVDHSGVMHERASRRNAAAIRAGRVTLLKAADDEIPPEIGPFDAILAVNALGFWSAPAERLAALRPRLSPGGRIAIVSQPRGPGATAETSRGAAEQIETLLIHAGFTHPRTQSLALAPPAVCVIATTSTQEGRAGSRP
jgi:protein-L-isoaspartate O-methyltransferase